MNESIKLLRELDREAEELSKQLTSIQCRDILAQGRTVSGILLSEWDKGERGAELEQEVLAAILFCQNKILLALEAETESCSEQCRE